MNDKNIGYCGIDCSKCDTFIATKKDDNELRKKVAELWSKLNNVEILSEWINCDGCRIDGIKSKYCEIICEIRKCAVQKDDSIKNHTCGKCPKMDTCETLKTISGHKPEVLENLKKNK